MRALRGKDNHLFLHSENTTEVTCGRSIRTKDEIWDLEKSVREDFSGCMRFGAGYVLFICPEKQVIYDDKLPETVSVNPNRGVAEFVSHMRSLGLGAMVNYPVCVLSQGRQREETYGTYESHWNGYGAFLAYRSLCFSLPNGAQTISVMDLSDLELSQKQDLPSDLGDLLVPKETGPHLVYKKKNAAGKCIFNNAKFSRGNVMVFENPCASLPSLVLFRDSFSNLLLPLLCESFRRIVAVSSRSVYLDLVASEKPDYVVTQVAERYLFPAPILRYDLKDISGLTLDEIKSKKLNLA